MRTVLLLILLFLFQNLHGQLDTLALYKKDTLTLSEAKVLKERDRFMIFSFFCMHCQINSDKRLTKPYLDSVINIHWQYCYIPMYLRHCDVGDYFPGCEGDKEYGNLQLWVYYDGLSAQRIVVRSDTTKYTYTDLQVYFDDFITKSGLTNYAALPPFDISSEEYFEVNGKKIYWQQKGVVLTPKVQYYVSKHIMDNAVRKYEKH